MVVAPFRTCGPGVNRREIAGRYLKYYKSAEASVNGLDEIGGKGLQSGVGLCIIGKVSRTPAEKPLVPSGVQLSETGGGQTKNEEVYLSCP
jgi:hypothetical protein